MWDRLIPVLLLLILLDVATRRIAWDAAALKQYAGTVTGSAEVPDGNPLVFHRSGFGRLERPTS